MGNYDDQSEERGPPTQASGSAAAAADGRAEDFFSQGRLFLSSLGLSEFAVFSVLSSFFFFETV